MEFMRFGVDIVVFCLLAITTSLNGVGLLALLHVGLPPRSAIYSGPAVTLAMWSILIGVLLGVGVPGKEVTVVAWPLTLILAAYGIRQLTFSLIKSAWPLFSIALLVAILTTAPYFLWGLASYPGASFLDGWSYAAFGQYLWEYSRGTEGGLAPLYQYAAHLSHVRYIGAATLGLFSPLLGRPGDTQAALGLVLAWSFFSLASACLYLASTFGMGKIGTLTYVFVTVFSGYSVNIMSANALDNCISLSMLPALLGLARSSDLRRLPVWLLLAIVACGLLYAYPELCWVALLSGALVIVERAVRCRVPLFTLGLNAAVALLAGLALLTPFATDLISFFRGQATIALQAGTTRPGEGLFSELIRVSDIPWAFWGLGNAASLADASPVWLSGNLRPALGIVMTLVAGAGIVSLLRKRELATVVAIAMILAAAAVFAFNFRYSYGVFKILVTGWPLIALVVGIGADTLIFRVFVARWTAWRVAAFATIGTLAAYVIGLELLAFDRDVQPKTFEAYRSLQTVKSMVGTTPLAVAVGNDVASAWAVYELRDLPFTLSDYTGYMAQPHVLPYMERASTPTRGPPHYVLTDARTSLGTLDVERVWSQGAYELWRSPGDRWAILDSVVAPNGLEQWSGSPAFWVGTEPVDVHIVGYGSDSACISVEFRPGPNLPKQPQRGLQVSSNGGPSSIVSFENNGQEQISVPLGAGVGHLELLSLDRPEVSAPSPNGDQRTLMVGVKMVSLALDHCPSSFAP